MVRRNDVVDHPMTYALFTMCSYDPASNTWKAVAPMGNRRLGVGVAVTGGCLYAVGGSDGSAPLASVERQVFL